MTHIQSEQLRQLLSKQKVTPRWLSKTRFAYRNANLSVDANVVVFSYLLGTCIAAVIVIALS